MKKVFLIFMLFLLFFGGPIYVLLSGQLVLNQHWSKSNRSSAHIAPNPKKHKEAIVQIYAARTYGWRGMFAIHSWIAIKPKNAEHYRVYQALGWNKFRNLPILDIRKDIPDRVWFDHKPWIIFDARGKKAEKVITEIKNAVKNYPYKDNYRIWPGPNSNTFIAYVIRHSALITSRLPLTAIGKDYQINSICSKSLSKTGYQCSLKGLFGFTIAKSEGFEMNILGFGFSINANFPFVHLPGID